MSAFIGQEKIFNTINNYTWNTMPHTLLFIGEDGCGKTTIAKYLANKLGFRFIIIDTHTGSDQLIEYQQSPIKTIYLMDLTDIQLEKWQNIFLRFIEEPSQNVYTILISTSEIGILPTILNRCTKIRFESYTAEQLKQIKAFDNDLVYHICRTPGQLVNTSNDKISNMCLLCDKLISILPHADYANVISVATKINYKEDYNKFDFTAFFNAIEMVALDRYFKNKDVIALKVYKYTIKRLQEIAINHGIQKEPFMINFLDGLWKEVK